jgi:hypothetical protein
MTIERTIAFELSPSRPSNTLVHSLAAGTRQRVHRSHVIVEVDDTIVRRRNIGEQLRGPISYTAVKQRRLTSQTVILYSAGWLRPRDLKRSTSALWCPCSGAGRTAGSPTPLPDCATQLGDLRSFLTAWQNAAC